MVKITRTEGQHRMQTAMAFAARNAVDSSVLEIDVYDVIGESFWNDAVSAKQIRSQLRSSSAKTIKVRINSSGGDAFDGIAIGNDLRDHAARVEVDVTGIAASAATIIMAAGDDIRIADNAMVMIHEAWTIAMGGAADLDSAVRELQRVNELIAATYARLSKSRGKNISKERFAELMKATTWMTADEAVEYGLADKQSAGKQKIAASLWSPVMARAGAIPRAVAQSVLEGMSGHLDTLEPEHLQKLRAAAAQKGIDDESTPRTGATVAVPENTVRAGAGEAGSAGSRAGANTGANTGASADASEAQPDPGGPSGVLRVEGGRGGREPGRGQEGVAKARRGDAEVTTPQHLEIPEAKASQTTTQAKGDQMTEPKQAEPQAKPKAAPQGLLELLGAETETEAFAKASDMQKLHLAVLGITGAGSREMAMARISSWKDAAEREPTHTNRILDLESEVKKVKLEKTVVQLTADGKLAPSQQEWAKQTFPTAESLENFAATMPQLAKMGPGPTERASETVQLTASDREACRQLGLSEDDFLEAKKTELKNRAGAQVGG